eukprot:6956804-Prymnesium_polylepis.1
MAAMQRRSVKKPKLSTSIAAMTLLLFLGATATHLNLASLTLSSSQTATSPQVAPQQAAVEEAALAQLRLSHNNFGVQGAKAAPSAVAAPPQAAVEDAPPAVAAPRPPAEEDAPPA